MFTFPEQLPGPARFGKGCVMESVAATAVEYERAPRKALEDLRDALVKFEQAYNPTLVEQGWDHRTKTEYERWSFSRNDRVNLTDMRVCERLKFVCQCVAFARKHEPELFGILVVAPEQDELDLVSWISMFMRSANGSQTFNLGRYPLWEFERKLQEFEYEILRSTSPKTRELTDTRQDKNGGDRLNDNENLAILKASAPEAKTFMVGKEWCTAQYATERFGIQAPQLTKAATNAKGLFGVPVERRRAQVGSGKKGEQYVYHAGSLQLLADAIERANRGEE